VTATVDDLTGPVVQPALRRSAREPSLLLVPVAIGLGLLGVLAAREGGVVAADWVRLALIVVWSVCGALVVRQPPLVRAGRLILFGATMAGVAFATARYADYASGSRADVAGVIAPITCLVVVAVATHMLLAAPHGVLGTHSRRLGAAGAYAFAVAAGGWAAAGPGEVTVAIGGLAWTIGVLAPLPAAHRRYLASSGLDRQRLQWIGCGAAMAGEIAITMGALRLFVGWPTHAGAVAAAGTALIPAAFAASANPRIAGRIDRVLVHTVSFVGLTLVVVAVYVFIILGLGRAPTHDERPLLGLSMIAAGVAALAYLPARERLTDLANRLVYGERSAPDEALRTFGQRLTRATPMDELLLQLVESLRKTMVLRAAEVWTGGGEVLERVASVPDRGPGTVVVSERERPVVARAGASGNAWVSVWVPALLDGRVDAALRFAPITHSGELLGAIVVERAASGDPFTDEDDRVLAELARQVGLALHNVQLDSALQATLDEVRRQAEELRASRARIVATADAERRKIERNLHDGAQQHLVALAVNLRLVRDIVADDPGSATEMLDALAGEVKETIQELRDLAHGIYPPLLLDSGLVDALRAAANRSPLIIAIEADGIGRYPAEVEAAVYFCCLEALQNTAKHAPASHVRVRLSEESGGLLFAVSDDGPGFDPVTAQHGHGFVNMSDRLGAIGGTVRWESTPGEGATVRGSIPLG
jgi:signal transduction histidine kinase